MLIVKGGVRFTGLVTVRVLHGWEGISVAWANEDASWDNWL
jgi:hypothetical protein